MAGKPKKKKEDEEFKEGAEDEAQPAEDDLKEPDLLEDEDEWTDPVDEEDSY